MAYTPTNWANGNTVTPALLNNIEAGVSNAINGRPSVVVDATSGDFPVSGYANASAAVQAAADSLTSGGEIKLRRGVYNFTSQVNLTNQQTKVTGEGFSTQVQWSPGTTQTGQYLFRTNSYCEISSMLLRGQRASVTGGNAIHVYQSARARLASLYIQDFAQDAINLTGTASNLSSHAAELDHLKIINCGGYGIITGAFAYDTSITRAWIATCNVGVRLTSGNWMMTDVHIWGSIGNGMELRSGSNKLVNAYFDSNGAKGIDMFDCSDNQLIGVDVWESGSTGASNGIAISGTASRNIIQGCTFRDNNGQAIALSGTGTDNEITGNTFRDTQGTKTQTYAITGATGGRTVIANNVMRAADHLTGAHNLTANTYSSFNNTGVDPEAVQALGSVNGTVALDRREAGTITATLNGNWTTVTVPSTYVPTGSRLRLILTQDATGGRTITWPANVKLAGGALTLSAATKVDIVELIYDGTNWRELSRALNG